VIFIRFYWFGVLILSGLLVTCSSADAQQPKKIPHIGFVSPVDVPHYFLAFRQGLRELGYIEGQNLFIEFRSANGVPNRLSELVADLVGPKSTSSLLLRVVLLSLQRMAPIQFPSCLE
jgi:putative ABC transport system substrate-binding protein